MSEITARYPLRALFAEFPTAVIEALDRQGETDVYAGWSTPIEYVGTPTEGTHVVIVRDGKVRVLHPQDTEMDRTLLLLDAGSIWVDPGPSARTLAAAPRAVLTIIPRSRFDAIRGGGSPHLDLEIRRQADEQSRELQQRLFETSLSVERRILLELERWGVRQQGGSVVTERMTQEMLASLAGSCRETTSRILGGLVRSGRLRRFGTGRYILEEPKTASLATAS